MAIRDLFARFTIKFDRKSAQNADRQIERLKKQIKALGASVKKTQNELKALKAGTNQAGKGMGVAAQAAKAFAAAFAVTLVKDFVSQTLDAADAVGKTSKALKIGTQDLQAWQQITREAGGANEDFTTSARTLARNLEQATRSASGPAAVAFKALNVDIKNTDGTIRSVTDLLPELGFALNQQSDESSRLAFAQNTLGRSALKLLPAFEGTREEFEKNFDAMRQLAEVYDEDFIRQSEAVNDEMSRLGLQFNKFRVQLIALLIPALRAVSQVLTPLMNGLADVTKNTKIMQAAFIMLGSLGIFRLFRMLAPVIARLGGFRKAIALVARHLLRFLWPLLLIDDLLSFLDGKRSLIGRFIDSLLGVGKAQEVAQRVREAFGTLFEVVSTFWAMITSDSEESSAAAREAFNKATEAMKAAWAALWESIKAIAAAAWEVIKKAAAEIGPFLAGVFTQLGSDLMFIFGQAIDWVIGKFQALIATVTGGVGKALGAIGSLFGGDNEVEVKGNLDGAALAQAAQNVGARPQATSTSSTTVSTVNLNDNRTITSQINANGVSGKVLSQANNQARRNLSQIPRTAQADFKAVAF